MSYTEKQYEALKRRDVRKTSPLSRALDVIESFPVTDRPKPSKYHAVLTECDGIKFQSKKEARYYRELKARIHAGEVAYFLRQVPFDLVGGVKYRVDFMEVFKDGRIRYVDVKGFRTQTYRMKRRMVEASYPGVKIEEA